MPFRSASGPRAAAPLASLLLIAFVALGLWIHRFEIARPESRKPGPQTDTYLYFEPSAAFIHDELRSGRLPLWNPYQMAGQPTLGLHVPAVLYPPNLLVLAALPPRLALPTLAVLHVLLAGLFTWLFAGRLGLAAHARLVAAVAFMLGPTLLVGLYVPPYLATPAWLPAMLWSLHGLASEVRPRWALGLGAALGLSFLGGHAQGFLYAAQVAALYGLFTLFCVARPGARLRVCALAGVAGLVAFAIAAPQLLPALELARAGVRGLDGLALRQAAFSPVTRPMIALGLLGALGPSSVSAHALQPFLLLPLVACGAFARRHRAHWIFFLLLLPVLGLFLTGGRSPVFRLYYELPLGDLFRLPHRMGFAYALCGAVLAGIGADALVRWLRGAARDRRGAATLPALLALVLVATVGADRYARTAFPQVHPAVDDRATGSSALLAFLRDGAGLDRVFFERPNPLGVDFVRKSGTLARAFVVPDYEPNMPGDYARFLGLTGARTWHGDLRVAPGPRSPRLRAEPARLDLMSVRFYAAPDDLPSAPKQELRRLAPDGVHRLDGVTVFERRAALPRLYTVQRARYVPDLDAALVALDAEDFAPRGEAVLIGRGPPAPPPFPRLTRPEPAVVDAYGPQRVVARAGCEARCLLVLTDLHYPGWRVRVDGEARTLERANGIFRGVWIEPGSHEVVFSYEPTSFRAGLALLAAGALATAGGVAYSSSRRRRAP